MKNYHLCFTSHREVMFRNEADMNAWFNCFCSALYKTDSSCYTESTMSDHFHSCCRSKWPSELMMISRDSYTKLFNYKYLRDGPLGEKGFLCEEISGYNHLITEFSYTLRNSVHHGIVTSPFEYKYCSVNCYFRKQLGKDIVYPKLLTPEQIVRVLSRRAEFDPSWKMSPEGVFLRESVLDIAAVEANYATPQAFLFYMGRKSGDDWQKEQEKDAVDLPIVTLGGFERMMTGTGEKQEQDIATMLRNEKSRKPVFSIDDIALCEVIDTKYVPMYGCKSVYQLNEAQKNNIGNELYSRWHARVSQIKRCLVL